MYTRAEVYSPLQNTAVWLAAWLYGHEPTDELVAALRDLGGPHAYGDAPLSALLNDVRSAASLTSPEPVVRLILWGPGQAAAIPPASPALQALTPAGALALRESEHVHHLLVPSYGDDGVQWRWFEEHERLPEPAWLSPGEADALLVEATDRAALLIEAAGGASAELPSPRLTMGSLADFYDAPGLPGCVPPRSAKLFARADSVAAIVETVTDRLNDHSLDPHLFALWRHIRTARMAGVANAVHELWREAYG
ncbi:hypothetical protein [Corynebacterium timonense]|uniref:Uncharacterized protein n=1 Tax=Corynebacterium timonense TaxID=441500 RepID=A0A1H1P2H2_9CORY|nr:hypothetical protein [Corynebacterium timonense]SDS05414.1 hypothetical protein SAMN04488539_0913 [Corynebacterium timonense]